MGNQGLGQKNVKIVKCMNFQVFVYTSQNVAQTKQICEQAHNCMTATYESKKSLKKSYLC